MPFPDEQPLLCALGQAIGAGQGVSGGEIEEPVDVEEGNLDTLRAVEVLRPTPGCIVGRVVAKEVVGAPK